MQKLLAKLCRLPPVHQAEGGRLRTVPVLPQGLQGPLPQRLDLQVGRSESKWNFPSKNLKQFNRSLVALYYYDLQTDPKIK